MQEIGGGSAVASAQLLRWLVRYPGEMERRKWASGEFGTYLFPLGDNDNEHITSDMHVRITLGAHYGFAFR